MCTEYQISKLENDQVLKTVIPQVISNEKLKSAIHRVVTNSTESRTTIGMFVIPSNDITIEPARNLTSDLPAVYTSYVYKDFFSTFTGKDCEAETALNCFRLVD